MLRRGMLLVAGGVLVLGSTRNNSLGRQPTTKGRCIAALAALVSWGRLEAEQREHLVGTNGDDSSQPDQLTDGVDVICAFGGNDSIATVGAGDILSGGNDNDVVTQPRLGTFNGDEGDDRVTVLRGGVCNGGLGADSVLINLGGTFNQD